jgi:hypothetical protein
MEEISSAFDELSYQALRELLTKTLLYHNLSRCNFPPVTCLSSFYLAQAFKSGSPSIDLFYDFDDERKSIINFAAFRCQLISHSSLLRDIKRHSQLSPFKRSFYYF